MESPEREFLTISEGENVNDKLFENGGQSVGIKYNVFAKKCKFSEHSAGKVMGLAQYKNREKIQKCIDEKTSLYEKVQTLDIDPNENDYLPKNWKMLV